MGKGKKGEGRSGGSPPVAQGFTQEQQAQIYQGLFMQAHGVLEAIFVNEDSPPKVLAEIKDVVKRAVDEHLNLAQQMMPILLKPRGDLTLRMRVVRPSGIISAVPDKAVQEMVLPHLDLEALAVGDQLDWITVYSIASSATIRAIMYKLGYRFEFFVDQKKKEDDKKPSSS